MADYAIGLLFLLALYYFHQNHDEVDCDYGRQSQMQMVDEAGYSDDLDAQDVPAQIGHHYLLRYGICSRCEEGHVGLLVHEVVKVVGKLGPLIMNRLVDRGPYVRSLSGQPCYFQTS